MIISSGGKIIPMQRDDRLAIKPSLTMKGHSDWVDACAFSPDGALIVSGSLDNTLKIWDVRTGKVLRTLKAHLNHVLSCAFSSDGVTVVSGSADNTVKLWDARTGKELWTLEGHSGEVYGCAVSPDGNTVVVGLEDNTLKLWDIRTKKELRTLTGHAAEVFACAFSPDGTTILSGSNDNTLKLWDFRTGEELRRMVGHTNSVNACAFSPDGALIISGSDDKTLKLWDAMTGKELRTLRGHALEVNACAFSPDGTIIVSGSGDMMLKVWDVQTGKELLTLQGHSGVVVSCTVSPNGVTVASGSSDTTINLWDISSVHVPVAPRQAPATNTVLPVDQQTGMKDEIPFPAYRGKEPFIFVSYAHNDKAVVYSEILRLHTIGYRIWYDQGIGVSKEWIAEIVNAIDTCSFFVVFFSPTAAKSKYVKREIVRAIKNDKPFLAIFLQPTTISDAIQFEIDIYQHLFKYNRPDTVYLEELTNALPVETKNQPLVRMNLAAGQERFLYASYAHADKDRVDPILTHLLEKGVSVWSDEGVSSAETRREIIADKINGCAAFIVFLSPQSVTRLNVLEEIELAIRRYEKREIVFIPLYLELFKLPDELRFKIGALQAIIKPDLSDFQILDRLIDNLKDILSVK